MTRDFTILILTYVSESVNHQIRSRINMKKRHVNEGIDVSLCKRSRGVVNGW